ncbi:MAG: hypothetical protein HY898_29460 [Deltaproteobacteria bacterium]|nr:hypothetical protein [Deltaproteobacteria bacterium]
MIRSMVGVASLGVFAAIALGACCQIQENASASAKCASSPTAEECQECCKGEGVNGHSIGPGQGCKCIDVSTK